MNIVWWFFIAFTLGQISQLIARATDSKDLPFPLKVIITSVFYLVCVIVWSICFYKFGYK